MTTAEKVHHRRPWSLAIRLFALYFISAAVLFAFGIFWLYISVHEEILDEDELDLADQMARLQRFYVDLESNRPDNWSDRQGRSQYLMLHSFLARLIDPNGQVIVETAGMSSVLPARVFPSPSTAGIKGVSWQVDADHRYILASSWTNDSSRRGIVQIALDKSASMIREAHLRRQLWTTFTIGMIGSSAVCIWVIRRALRPIESIAEVTSAVEASHLDLRIDAEEWPIELARFAAAFNRMLERLDSSFQRLRFFSAELSHELRTPINILRGEAEVALSRPRTADEYRDFIESSLEEYEHLIRLIEDMLFLARTENAEPKLSGETVETINELTAVADFYGAASEEKGVMLRVSGEGRVHVSRDHFRRMFSNLAANALRHTPPGGSIEFSSSSRPDGSVIITVTDTGEGIPAEHLGRICDRFYRVDSPILAQQGKGLGLGLAIVKSLVELHRASLTIESVVGQGTRVIIAFPPSPA